VLAGIINIIEIGSMGKARSRKGVRAKTKRADLVEIPASQRWGKNPSRCKSIGGGP
jgi:hypothetical protein